VKGSFPQALQSFSKKLLIPKDELMGKVLTMRTSLTDEKTGQKTQYKIVNCPVMVESQKFNRFQFKFNFGFILKRDYDENGEVGYFIQTFSFELQSKTSRPQSTSDQALLRHW
jgi:hypothetical protein